LTSSPAPVSGAPDVVRGAALTPRELDLVSTTFSCAWGVGLMGGVGVGVVTYLHCVVSGSDQMRWKPSRWARSINSSFSRVVSIFGVLLECTGAGVS